MGQPVLNGALASTTGVSLAQRAAHLAPEADDVITSTIGRLNSVGIGLVLAIAVLAYWYRRIL